MTVQWSVSWIKGKFKWQSGAKVKAEIEKAVIFKIYPFMRMAFVMLEGQQAV